MDGVLKMDENDLRRRARKTGFNVATLEKDYALTWLLSGFTRMTQSSGIS